MGRHKLKLPYKMKKPNQYHNCEIEHDLIIGMWKMFYIPWIPRTNCIRAIM